MTGPEHYRAAERLIAAANQRLAGDDSQWLQTSPRRAELRAEAQVHATLALAAATALIDEKPRSGSFDAWREWNQATGSADYPAVTP